MFESERDLIECRRLGTLQTSRDLRPESGMRTDGRQPNDLRRVRVQRKFTAATPGSVLLQAGGTIVLCTASVEEGVPPWKKTAAGCLPDVVGRKSWAGIFIPSVAMISTS